MTSDPITAASGQLGGLPAAPWVEVPAGIDCPRAKTCMTPCIARDGATALDDLRAAEPSCVGCGEQPRALLLDLSNRYAPARRYRQTHDPRGCADRLTQLVKQYTDEQAAEDNHA